MNPFQGPGTLLSPHLEEDFIGAIGRCAVDLLTSGEERYSSWLSEGFGIDSTDISDPFWRDCFERIRTLTIGEKGFSWRVLQYELIEAGHPYQDYHIKLIDLICDNYGGYSYQIPALRKRLEEMAHRRRQEGVEPKGWKERSYRA